MSIEKTFRKLISPSTTLQGGIAPRQLGEKRVRALVAIIADTGDPTGSGELGQGVGTDWYHPSTRKKNGDVSLEGAHERESQMRDVLDGRVTADNLGWDDEGSKGLKPCDLLKRSKTGKNRCP